MSAEDIDPESTIPWPGFVDILSTVIIVFIFFMMMTSVIIFVLSEQAQKAAVDNAVKESKQDVSQTQTPAPDATLAPDVNNLLVEKENLRKEVDRLTQLKNVLSESVDQKAVRENNTILISFGDMGATLTPETTEQIKAALPYTGHVMIASVIPEGTDFGSIREVALNRALNIRNILLQGEVPRENIGLRINVNKEANDNPYGNVTLTFTE